MPYCEVFAFCTQSVRPLSCDNGTNGFLVGFFAAVVATRKSMGVVEQIAVRWAVGDFTQPGADGVFSFGDAGRAGAHS